ncbi:MAG TPA: type 4a pilus biogenesis protein PilO [Actinomycetota bacterium]|jgi:Tfp pilus assembly protein PilO
MIIAIAGGIVVCLLFYVLAIRPRQSELKEVEAQVGTETAKTASLQSQLDQLEALQRQAPELQADLADIRDLVPEDDQVPNFIFQVQESANAAGVDFVEITPELPRTPPETATLAQVRATLGAQGGYFAVQDFIRRLYDLDRALRIDGLSMAQISPESADVTFTATARIFYELPEGAAPPIDPNAVVPPPAPAATPSP